MPIADPTLGVLVIILGLLLFVGGIVVAAVVYREGRKLKNLIMPLLDMLDLEMLIPELPMLAALGPILMEFVKDLLKRVFNYVDIVGLLGGAAVSIVGILIFLMGLAIAG